MNNKNNTFYVLVKSTNNYDLSADPDFNQKKASTVMGIYSSRENAYSKIKPIGSNLNYKYEVQGPFILDDGIFVSPEFIPPQIKPLDFDFNKIKKDDSNFLGKPIIEIDDLNNPFKKH